MKKETINIFVMITAVAVLIVNMALYAKDVTDFGMISLVVSAGIVTLIEFVTFILSLKGCRAGIPIWKSVFSMTISLIFSIGSGYCFVILLFFLLAGIY